MTINTTLTTIPNAQLSSSHTKGEWRNYWAFALIKTDGSVVAFGDSGAGGDISAVANLLNGTIDVTQIFSNGWAFAALRTDGSVVAWGSINSGGDASAVASALNGTIKVTQIFSASQAFAALRQDGSVISWGSSVYGGDNSMVASALNGTIKVTQIFSTFSAFAALRTDGSVISWGSQDFDGKTDSFIPIDTSKVANAINGTIDVTQIFSNDWAFAALRTDGSVVAWGDNAYGNYGGDTSAVASALNGSIDVTQIFSTEYAFAALRTDGSVVAWGDSSSGGDISSVANKLNGTIDVTQISSNRYNFAALRTDGSVVAWGGGYSGDTSAVASALDGTIKVTQIFSTEYAFAALRTDGSVVAWGDSSSGGDASAVANALNGSIKVTQIFSTNSAFAALRADGSVVSWGASDWNGTPIDTSKVAKQLDGTIDVKTIYTAGIVGFAALRVDGSVVAWGSQLDSNTNSFSPMDTSKVANQLTSGVISGANILTNDVVSYGNVNHLPTGKVSISGTPTQNQTLTVSNTLADVDGLGAIHYQWKADGVAILNATANTYKLTQAEVGKTISVTASYTDKAGFAESVASVATTKIGAFSNGTANADVLLGTTGNDSLSGLGGNDVLVGDAGNDTLDGGIGNDSLIAGSGNDTYLVDSVSDTVVESNGAGTDTIKTTVSYALPANVENLTLTGTTAINATGNLLTNVIIGNTGNNILNGALGNDTLTGNAGKDTFLFNTAITANIDKITDFSVIDDTIQLENLIFSKLTAIGVLNANNFVINATALDNNDYLIYNKTSGALFYDADANGANNPVQIATLGLNLALNNNDFIVI